MYFYRMRRSRRGKQKSQNSGDDGDGPLVVDMDNPTCSTATPNIHVAATTSRKRPSATRNEGPVKTAAKQVYKGITTGRSSTTPKAQKSQQQEESDDDSSDSDEMEVGDTYTGEDTGDGVFQNALPSTAIADLIPKRLQNKIKQDKYIELNRLLPQTTSSPKWELNITKDKNLVVGNKVQYGQINNIERWTSAFIKFVAIYTEEHPLSAPHLMKYMEIVRDLARRGGYAWRTYDEQVRKARETTKLPWHVLHSEYWLIAANPPINFQNRQEGFNRSPFQHDPRGRGIPSYQFTGRSKYSNGGTTSQKFPRGTCWGFLRTGACTNKKCPFSHPCRCKNNRHDSKCPNANTDNK